MRFPFANFIQVFVNDIIVENNIEKVKSLLFADDLLSMITDPNLNRIKLNMLI